MSSLLIIGAGGHGASVAEAAVESKKFRSIAFIDDKFHDERIVITGLLLGVGEI